MNTYDKTLCYNSTMSYVYVFSDFKLYYHDVYNLYNTLALFDVNLILIGHLYDRRCLYRGLCRFMLVVITGLCRSYGLKPKT